MTMTTAATPTLGDVRTTAVGIESYISLLVLLL
jgi:hypothetical protein